MLLNRKDEILIIVVVVVVVDHKCLCGVYLFWEKLC